VADEKPQVPAPDGLVNESSGAGEDEQEGQKEHFGRPEARAAEGGIYETLL
jgi:hypothetical protein